MRRVVNKTHRPLRIHLPQGKVLHLGPHNEGQVSPHVIDCAGIQKLVAAGDIEVLTDEGQAEAPSPDGSASHADTHGHHPDTGVRNRGDR